MLPPSSASPAHSLSQNPAEDAKDGREGENWGCTHTHTWYMHMKCTIRVHIHVLTDLKPVRRRRRLSVDGSKDPGHGVGTVDIAVIGLRRRWWRRMLWLIRGVGVVVVVG